MLRRRSPKNKRGSPFPVEEFLKLVDNAMLKDSCVELSHNLDKDGYPVITDGDKKLRAGRLALAHKLGRPIESGKYACHTCNNRRCINANHLYEGTAATNFQDALDSGSVACSPEGWKSNG